jgi:hypothetical protein
MKAGGKVPDYSACCLLLCSFLASLILQPWSWRRYVPPKRQLTFNILHGIISRKITLFIANYEVYRYGVSFSLRYFVCLRARCFPYHLLQVNLLKQVIATSRLFKVIPTEVISLSFAAKSWLRWNLATERDVRHKCVCIWQLTYCAQNSCTRLLKQHMFCLCSYAGTTKHKRAWGTVVQWTYCAQNSCTRLLKQHMFCVCSYAGTTEHKRAWETAVQLGARKQARLRRVRKEIRSQLADCWLTTVPLTWPNYGINATFLYPHFRRSTIGEQECIFQMRCAPLLALIWNYCRYISARIVAKLITVQVSHCIQL